MDNYQVLTEQQQQNQSSKNKKRIIYGVGLLSLLIIALIGSVCLFTETKSNNPSQLITNMIYLNQSSNDIIITSQRNMTVCTSQKGEHLPMIQEQCTVYSSIQDILAQNLDNDKIIAHIVYRDIQSFTQYNSEEESIPTQDNEFAEIYNEDVHLIFKATISREGNLLKLEQPQGNPVSQIAIRLTERLIEQYFPQLNATLYLQSSTISSNSTSSNNNNLLRSSQQSQEEEEQKTNEITEETYLGEVKPSYTYEILPEGEIILSKVYNQENFKNFQYSLGGKIPNISFESNFFIRNGKVEQNIEIMEFNMTHTHNDILLSQSNENSSIPINNSTEYEELIGQAFTRIESVFQLINATYNQTLINEIQNYENNSIFEDVHLEETTGKLKIMKNKNILSEGQENNNNTDITPMISKKYDVFRKSIVGNTISLTIEYFNYENHSIIDSSIFLNDIKIFTVYSKRIDHPWYACEESSKSDTNTLKKTVFAVVYPLLGGVINIPITANLELEYVWTFETSKNEQGLCTLEFHPFAKPTLGVEGYISVWKVAEGGVFAKGSVANVYLDFFLQLDRINLQAIISVDAHLIPFQYKIGAFYSYIKCDIKNVKDKILQFKWKEICYKTNREEFILLEGSLISPLNYNLYTETSPLISPSMIM